MSAHPGLPSIAVVVPSLNQGRYLGQALDSIVRQGYPRIQVAVVDGGSTDDSVSIIRNHARHLAYWRSHPDGGQAAAINEGVARTDSDLVAWLNADDFYLADALWIVAAAWQQDPRCAVYIGNGLRLGEDGEGRPRWTPFCRRELALDRQALTHGLDYILQQATFFSRPAWQEAGGLDPELHYGLDWDILIRITVRHSAVLINEFLAVLREHPAAKTATGGLRRVAEIARLVERHTGRPLTPGSLAYLLDTVLHLPASDVPPDATGHLWQAYRAVQGEFARRWGRADGCPVRGDAGDHVYLPLSPGAAVPRPERRSSLPLPSISVVVPLLARTQPFRDTLDSVVAQAYPHLEVLVPEVGAPSPAPLAADASVSLSHWAVGSGRGVAGAINAGLRRATGEIVTWLLPDSRLTADALVSVAELFAGDPVVDLVYGNALSVDEGDRLCPMEAGADSPAFHYGELPTLRGLITYWADPVAIAPPVFLRRRLLDATGLLDETHGTIFDLEFLARLAAGPSVRKLERTQAVHRTRAGRPTRGGPTRRAELYAFSRRRWPPLRSRAYWGTLSSFLQGWARHRFGGRPGAIGQWGRLALAALSALTRVGNPEHVASTAARRDGRPVGRPVG